MHRLLAVVPEALIAYSCDKNFGLYRDRVGAVYTMLADAGAMPAVLSNGAALARAVWSMPPDHGAAAVRLILEDEALTGQWLDELDTMRARMRQVRAKLGEEGRIGSVDLAPLAEQNGLFAMLTVTPEQVLRLREDHGIYMAASGRINVAGLTMGNIGKFIDALRVVAG